MVSMLFNTEWDIYVIDLKISKSISSCQGLDVYLVTMKHFTIFRSLPCLYAIFLVKKVIKTYITAIRLLLCVNESSTSGK